MGAQECLSNYAILPIVVNRIIWSLTTLLHKKTTKSLDLERQGFCHMIWMMYDEIVTACCLRHLTSFETT
ncbi:Swainsonine transporter swnT [Fusarium oxysporum f. sp. albedinis]|nr:Swainsonine transporter swnT [Fusarium oxysporum f. sp. albedinis]